MNKDEKIKELLAVLDLPAKEQYFKVLELCDESPADRDCPSLADLAFRLRDEMLKMEHYAPFEARRLVGNYTTKSHSIEISEYWWACKVKPIHWIIAALIAKELAK
jgi:hypothetical protein